jgi:signal transduction histidine kinase
VASDTNSSEGGRLRRTLRGRVSLLGLGVIAAWVVVLTIGFDVAMRARLNGERDAVLSNRAATAAATVYLNAKGVVSVSDHRGDEALDTGIWVFSGARTVERPRGSATLQEAANALAGRNHAYGTSHKYRLYARAWIHDHRQVATVVAAVSDAPYSHALTESIEGSAVLGLLVLLGAYPVMRVAAGRALRPVDAMTRQAGHWSAHGLTERFGPKQRFREMQSLATTLDAVLDRLAAVVRHERQLPAELSHELRTPLARIVAEVDLLLARPHSAAELSAAHQAIRAGAQSMDQILETLLAAARADVQEAPGRCDLRPVMEKLVATYLGTQAEVDDPSFDVRIAAGLAVGADAAIIERVFAPLLDNARRYARASIQVTGLRTAESVMIDIIDDGPGVPVELREAVFEPGWRAAVDDGHDGAGLGLALSRRLARSVSGDVTVVGPGSRFRVRLPPA